MIVGYDLLFLVPGRSGGRETHARELLRALVARPGAPKVVAFLGAEAAEAGSGWWSELADDAVVLPRVSARSTPRWALGEAAGVVRAASRAGVDVLHGPANFVPVGGPFARVLTLHDVAWRRLPDLMPAPRRWATDALVAPGAKRAHRVITVSAASRDDIVTEYGIPATRIDVVPNGIAHPAQTLPKGSVPFVEGTDPFKRVVLSVATDLPHKNLGGVVEAIAAIEPAERPRLVVAGAGTDEGALPALVRSLGLDGDVELCGAVDAATLESLYEVASAYLTATLYEGFGFPVLEAMARGVPVVCSDLPVLREVAADAATYADPRDPNALADALRAVLRTPDHARIEAGRARAASFTWEAAAEATLGVYERAIAERGRG